MKQKSRTKITGEVFTPLDLVNEMLDKIPDNLINNQDKTVIDPACGNGQFLIAVARRRQCLSNIFGVDLMVDNVCDTIARLHYFKHHGVDLFDHTGHTPHLKDPGHKDIHPDFYWLANQHMFTRIYDYNDIELKITIGGTAGEDGVIFKCNGELYPTIVCANSLEFFKNGADNGYKHIWSAVKEFNKNNSVKFDILEEQVQVVDNKIEVITTITKVPTVKAPKKVKPNPQIVKLEQQIQANVSEMYRLDGVVDKTTADVAILKNIEQKIVSLTRQLNELKNK